MEETISLKEIYQVLKKRILLIITLTVLAVAASATISYFVLTPTYQASSQFIVNQNPQEQNANYNVNDIRTNLELINTYNVIIKSPRILDKVVERLELDMSAGALSNKIQVASARNSQVVNVTVTDPDQFQAAAIANTTFTVFKEELPQLMNVNNVSMLSEAVASPTQGQVSPNPVLNMAIAFVVGMMASVGLVFLLEYMDNTIKNEEDIEKTLGLPVLGAISQMKESELQNNDENIESPRTVARGESFGA